MEMMSYKCIDSFVQLPHVFLLRLKGDILYPVSAIGPMVSEQWIVYLRVHTLCFFQASEAPGSGDI